MSTKKVVIFASGSGTNAENIITYFQNSVNVNVISVFCNKKNAGVLDRAKRLNVDYFLFTKEEFTNSSKVIDQLKAIQPDLIVLAGFLLKVPETIISAFNEKIINIHPALLPKYGGKGMYGMHVHKAVVEHKEKETGISIHYVNQNYDEGALIFQARCHVDVTDTPEEVAAKIHELEMEHFPRVIETLLV